MCYCKQLNCWSVDRVNLDFNKTASDTVFDQHFYALNPFSFHPSKPIYLSFWRWCLPFYWSWYQFFSYCLKLGRVSPIFSHCFSSGLRHQEFNSSCSKLRSNNVLCWPLLLKSIHDYFTPVDSISPHPPDHTSLPVLHIGQRRTTQSCADLGNILNKWEFYRFVLLHFHHLLPGFLNGLVIHDLKQPNFTDSRAS